MPIIITIFRILQLFFFMKVQDIRIIPMSLFFWIQVVEYFSVGTGKGPVKCFPKEFRVAFVCFRDVSHPVGIAFDQLLIPIFPATGYQNNLLSRFRLDIHAVTVLIFSLTAAPLEIIQQTISVTVQNIKLCGCH